MVSQNYSDFLAKSQYTLLYFVNKLDNDMCQILTFKVNFQYEESSESF